MSDRNLRELKRIYKRMDNIKSMAVKFNSQTSLSEIKSNLILLNDEWKEYKALAEQLDETETVLKQQDLIDDQYFNVKRVLLKILNEPEVAGGSDQKLTIEDLMVNQQSFLKEMVGLCKRETEVRLPELNIPFFSGKFSEFASFRDLFEASVGNNERISKVHKFQYLKSLLRDDAASLVTQMDITEANYDEAWAKLKSRYEKKKRVIKELIKRFMEQPDITHSTTKALDHMADISDEVLRGLKVLGSNAETRDPWLVYILKSKLNHETKQAWSRYSSKMDFPTIDDFFKFLNGRSDELDCCDTPRKQNKPPATKIAIHHTQTLAQSCPKCTKNHVLNKCEEFLLMNNTERRGFVVDKKLCFNCLSETHQAFKCKSKFRCFSCKRRHHTLLHTDLNNTLDTVKILTPEGGPNQCSSTVECNKIEVNTAMATKYQSILPTAIAEVRSVDGEVQRCRILLDSGSQSSFVTEACIQRLRLPRENAKFAINGIATSNLVSRGATKLFLTSIHDYENKIDVDALILKNLPSKIPRQQISLKNSNLFKNIQLADSEYFRPSEIDILIGADKFFHILQDGRIMSEDDTVVAQKTIFGWIISGQPHSLELELNRNLVGCNFTTDLDINTTLRKFWELEEVKPYQSHTPEERQCEEIFKKTTLKETGRYVVNIPFKTNAPKLGNSLSLATKRFFNLERKFQLNENLKNEYINTMREYQNLGHMVHISENENDPPDSDCYYLPHHAVIKETSTTTKVRVVFDGSSKTTTGISLNETMMVGPTIQPTLWSILLRFRQHKIAITADIEKMYRQVLVNPKHTEFQRILWRESPSEKLKKYRLTTVTFGLASSPFLAIRSLQQTAIDQKLQHLNKLSNVFDEFYVDDFIGGSSTIEEAKVLRDKITLVLKTGGFHLRKWKSNIPDLFDQIDKTSNVSFDHESEVTKILGLRWNPVKDIFTFSVNLETTMQLTKRRILSESSRIFDPLGWISPCTILFKILMQQIWMLKVDWDDLLPKDISDSYSKIKGELNTIENIAIARYIQYQQAEYHGFCDASERAFGAVIYCKYFDENGHVQINLVTAKTKVAPIKQVSIPRLELCAAHLLVKLWNVLRVNVPKAKFYAWTDSTIVLQWLSNYPATWKTFVANRTAEILESTTRQNWNHVKSEHNPADHISRGVTPSELVKLSQWWNGPYWLKDDENAWPRSDPKEHKCKEETDEEKKAVKVRILQTESGDNFLLELSTRFSSYLKLIRTLRNVLRFLNNVKRKSETLRKYVIAEENDLQRAENILIKWTQYSEYEQEIEQLSKKIPLNRRSKLLSLAPFIDADGILRVGGRLRKIDGQYDQKHPIILPSSHFLCKMIIADCHKKYFHPGPSLTSHLIKQKFWIVGGRSQIRSQLQKCLTCFKENAKTSQQLMGSLPEARITPARPFSRSGVDYAGPIQIATKRGRGAKLIKGYIAIFVCMATKAIHIEVVSDLTTEAFIAALKRFAARRGVPNDIYSDNGTNFVGAHRKLKDIYHLLSSRPHNEMISEFLSQNRTNWHFIPSSAAHFGGLWERAVRSVKSLLMKATGGCNLTFEEMATLLSQIESILNSRPLAASNDESSCEALTPSHFLIGSATGTIPEEDLTTIPVSRLKRWQIIQQRTQLFWKRYSREYLHTLQQRNKWKTQAENIKVGDLVMMKMENLPPSKWALARVTEIHPGEDNLVRVVTLKTSTSTLKRPITRVAKLPVQI